MSKEVTQDMAITCRFCRETYRVKPVPPYARALVMVMLRAGNTWCRCHKETPLETYLRRIGARVCY